MTANPHHSVSVAGIVVREDGRILTIQHRDTDQWEPPGGILELDETFEDGVRREVAEETGVAVEVERLTGAYKNLSRGVVAWSVPDFIDTDLGCQVGELSKS